MRRLSRVVLERVLEFEFEGDFEGEGEVVVALGGGHEGISGCNAVLCRTWL